MSDTTPLPPAHPGPAQPSDRNDKHTPMMAHYECVTFQGMWTLDS
ncbi:MAG: hypothetical protein Q7T78_11660 [Rhodoferax sp.]|nr:hypothetical protein [Rhodoferax sp.]